MKPTKELISALRNVAYKVSNNPKEWDWELNERCNCGLLAQEFGISAESITKLRMGTWKILEEGYRRGDLDSEMKEVMDTLLEKGLEQGDLDYLEREVTFENDPQDLSDFFLELADKLETKVLMEVK